jgi:hypothetical protein
MLKLAATLYAILAPTAAGVLMALTMLTETLASGLGMALAGLVGAGSAWPVSWRAARVLRREDAA